MVFSIDYAVKDDAGNWVRQQDTTLHHIDTEEHFRLIEAGYEITHDIYNYQAYLDGTSSCTGAKSIYED